MGFLQGNVVARVKDGGGIEYSTDGGATWTAPGGGFGADTTVRLANSGAALVNALELVASLTTETAGAEVSQWVGSVLVAGAPVTAFVATGNSFQVPIGTIPLPGLSFQGHTGTGIAYDVGTSSMFFSVGGAQVLGWSAAGVGSMLADASHFVMGTLSQGYFGMSGLNARMSSTLGDMQLGAGGSNLAQNAVLGFVDIPLITVSAAGAPSGTPTKVPSGMGAIGGIDATNNKLWVWTGAAWKAATLA